MLSNWQTLSLIPTRTNTDSSCSVLCRASTSRNVSQIKEVHGRDNLGHAAAGRSRMTLFGIMACKIQSRLWVLNGPRVASELGPFIPQQRTWLGYFGMSVWCQKQTYRGSNYFSPNRLTNWVIAFATSSRVAISRVLIHGPLHLTIILSGSDLGRASVVQDCSPSLILTMSWSAHACLIDKNISLASSTESFID